MIFKKQAHEHGVSKRVRYLAWLSVIGWTFLIAALVIFHYGRPEQQYGLLTYFGVEARTAWIAELRFWYIVLLIACTSISLLSLFINRDRVERHHRIRYNVVLLLLISTALLIGLLVD